MYKIIYIAIVSRSFCNIMIYVFCVVVIFLAMHAHPRTNTTSIYSQLHVYSY